MEDSQKELLEENNQAIAKTKALIAELQQGVIETKKLLDIQQDILKIQRNHLKDLESKTPQD